VLYSDYQTLNYLNSQKRLNARHDKWVEFLQDYTFVLRHKAGVENKVADVLSRHVMILAVMSAEVTGFERLKEEYASCPTLEKYMSHHGTVLFERWTNFYYKTNIYSGFVSYVFPLRPSWSFSFEKCMLEIWLDTSARARQLRLLNTDSTGRA